MRSSASWSHNLIGVFSFACKTQNFTMERDVTKKKEGLRFFLLQDFLLSSLEREMEKETLLFLSLSLSLVISSFRCDLSLLSDSFPFPL